MRAPGSADVMRSGTTRRDVVIAAAGLAPAALWGAADPFEGDPFQSHQWPELRKELLGRDARVRFDADRVRVLGPAFAEDAMNVPITVSALGLPDVQRIVVAVDRNPIRRVLELEPLAALPVLSFRFKLEQASPVRAFVLTRDGVWHVGGTWVESAGGGCTVPGATRKDQTWPQTLGQVSGRLFSAVPGTQSGARLRLRVMHPMDTGLVAGIPAFHVTRLAVLDADGRELARLATFEPVSENPLFSFDFASAPQRPLRVVGSDNNGNRIHGALP